MSELQAIVLAGGFGTRLKSRVSDLPKPMAPVAGRPFLEYVLEQLRSAGVQRVVLATGYLAHTIESHFGSRWDGLEIGYSHEETPLGTGGAVVQALRGLPRAPTLVVNGDTWLDADLAAFDRWAREVPGSLGILLRRLPDTTRYGTVQLEGDRIKRFGEKSGSGPGWINAGVYHLHAAHFEPYALPEAFSIEQDFFQRHAAALPLRGLATEAHFIDIGVPEEFDRAQTVLPRWREAARPARRAALFLDRDGVINVDHGHVHRIEQFQFLPGIFELVRSARARGLAVVVVTNQAGIGRGLYSEEDFQRLTGWMRARFADEGAPIDAVYHCPDHPEHGLGPYRRDTPMRKPGPGMLLQAARELQLDLAGSLIIGDKASDMQAGRRAGVARTVLLVAGGNAVADADTDQVVPDLHAARQLLEAF